MPFSLPGASGIRQSGANLTSQAGQIRSRTAASLGNIKLQTAGARAGAIRGRAGAFANALRQVGATAQQVPLIRQQREDRAQQTTLRGQGIEANQLSLAEAKKKAQGFEALRVAVAEDSDPVKVQTIMDELGFPLVGQGYAEKIEQARLTRVNLSIGEGRIYDAKLARTARVLFPWNNLDPEMPPEELNALYQATKLKLEEIDSGSTEDMPVDVTPFEAAKLQVAFSSGTAVADQVKLAAKPTLTRTTRVNDQGKQVVEFFDPAGNLVRSTETGSAGGVSKPPALIRSERTTPEGNKVVDFFKPDTGKFVRSSQPRSAGGLQPPPDLIRNTRTNDQGIQMMDFIAPETGEVIRTTTLGPSGRKQPTATGEAGFLNIYAKSFDKTVDELTLKEYTAGVREFAEAKREGKEPSLTPVQREIPQAETLYGSVNLYTTGIFSNHVRAFGVFFGTFPETVKTAQRFNNAQLALISAFSRSPRFPEGEAERIQKRINVSPSFFVSPDSLQRKLEEVDKTLRRELEDARAADEPKTVRAIESWLAVAGVPQQGSGGAGSAEATATNPETGETLDVRNGQWVTQ